MRRHHQGLYLISIPLFTAAVLLSAFGMALQFIGLRFIGVGVERWGRSVAELCDKIHPEGGQNLGKWFTRYFIDLKGKKP